MRRWIVASSEAEVAQLKMALNACPTGRDRGFPTYRGQIADEPISIGVLGVGVVSAALALGTLFAHERVDQAIMVGSAGAFPATELDVGDVAIASSETLAEMGVCAGRGLGSAEPLSWLGLEQTLLLDEPLYRDMIRAAEGPFRVRTGPFLTAVGVSDSEEQAAARAARFGALVENMEGYALALAGQRLGIRVAQVRGISNRAGVRDKSTWNLSLANEQAQAVVLNFLMATIGTRTDEKL